MSIVIEDKIRTSFAAVRIYSTAFKSIETVISVDEENFLEKLAEEYEAATYEEAGLYDLHHDFVEWQHALKEKKPA